jgi:hypothetical protein
MLSILHNIPDVKHNPLHYALEVCKPPQDALWLEFGVASGKSINYIAQFTQNIIFGFDSFEGLPEKWRDGFGKGAFNQKGRMPLVRPNVRLVKGWFSNTLPHFLQQIPDAKIGFLHLDADLYSSTKQVLDLVKDRLATNCIIVFDELVNYPGFAGPNGELRAFYEFLHENEVDYEWIGMHGELGNTHQNVAVRIKSCKPRSI